MLKQEKKQQLLSYLIVLCNKVVLLLQVLLDFIFTKGLRDAYVFCILYSF